MPSKLYADSASSSRGSSRDGYYDPRDNRPVSSQPSRSTSSKTEKPIIVDKGGKTYDDPHCRDQYSNKYR